jgi:threonine synthase
MELTSTTNPQVSMSWKSAVLSGLAPDGGLFIPRSIPRLTVAEIATLRAASFQELALEVLYRYLQSEIPKAVLKGICDEAFSFELPLIQVDEKTFVLELFHGPTCAFKDFGARFMARLFRYFLKESRDPLTILVATSGDTGSAVANAFLDQSASPPISVVVLFPKGKVSHVQEQQMTTLGHNVTALEIEGTFDDCQKLVKTALSDTELQKTVRLTSANSINIARLLPQSLYYIHAALKFPSESPPIFSVPSGNLGNVTGGLMASLMGIPISHFIVACNSNSVVPEFLATGEFRPAPSIETISNAMDVGNPSNFSRILALLGFSREEVGNHLSAYSINDEETRKELRDVFHTTGYLLDPHAAVGHAGLVRYRDFCGSRAPGIVLGTAHPAKFGEAVAACSDKSPELPDQLIAALNLKGDKISLSSEYTPLRQLLQSLR